MVGKSPLDAWEAPMFPREGMAVCYGCARERPREVLTVDGFCSLACEGGEPHG